MPGLAHDRCPPSSHAVDAVLTASEGESDDVVEVVAPPAMVVQSGVPDAVAACAAAPPPPRQPKHAPFSRRGMEESAPLRVTVPLVLPPPPSRPLGARLNLPAGPAAAVSPRRPSSCLVAALVGTSDIVSQNAASTSYSTSLSILGVGHNGSIGVASQWHAEGGLRRPGVVQGGSDSIDTETPDSNGALSRDGMKLHAFPSLGKRPRDAYPLPTTSATPCAEGRESKRTSIQPRLSYHMTLLGQGQLNDTHSALVPGGGGVGKTRLLRQIADLFQATRRGGRTGLRVLAPTGVVAGVTRSITVHAFVRLPLKCFDHRLTHSDDAARVYGAMDIRVKTLLDTTDLLLIDEVSMVSSRMFTVLVSGLHASRRQLNRAAPWRIIAFGDFFQQPAVYDTEDKGILVDTEAGYAFESPSSHTTFQNKMLELTYVWRQEDVDFIAMLRYLRVGTVTAKLLAFLAERQRQYQRAVHSADDLGLDITHIFPKTTQVQVHNSRCLETVDAKTGVTRVLYHAVDEAIEVDLSSLAMQNVE